MKKYQFGFLAVALAFFLAFSAPTITYADTTSYVQSDTTTAVYLPQGQTYQVKFTVYGTHDSPSITAGNGNALQITNTTKSKDASGNDVYYIKVKATGSPETTSAIYTTLPGQSAARQFVVTVIKTYSSGMYKVGTEIPAGEYVLIPTQDDAYFSVTSDSTGSLDSLLGNGFFMGRTIVTVSNGEYFNITDATAYPINEAPSIDKSATELSGGMYRVGIDIPAGEFQVAPIDSLGGYYEISTDSTHQYTSVVGINAVENQQYITISNGQYLELLNCKIILK